MIQIMKINDVDERNYEFVKCPVCRSRLCNKTKNAKTNIIQFPSGYKGSDKMNELLIHCRKCKSNFLVSMEN